jgi:hypothetical protein
MDSPPLLLIGGVVLVFGSVYLARTASEIRTVYHIIQNDPVPIRELPTRSGSVEIEGTARVAEDHEPIESIFTETPCLAFEYEIEEYRSSGKHSSWDTLEEGMTYVPFLIEDGTGTVEVRPEGAAFRFEDHSIRVDGGEKPPERIERYLQRTDAADPQNKSLNLGITELSYGNDQRFTERRLEPGEDAYVYGTVGRAQGGEWGSDLVSAAVEDGDSIPEFVVSDTSEEGTARRIRNNALKTGGLGLLMSGFGVVVLATCLL